MKAVILAGGRGSRMGALTESMPKPLVSVTGKPILEHIITYASEAGIREYIVNIGYRGAMIQSYFGTGSRLGVRMHYFEMPAASPEGALFASRQYLDNDDFCCFCGDTILLPWQIQTLVQLHKKWRADATFILEPGEEEDKKRVALGSAERRFAIAGTGTSSADYVLTYNFCSGRRFLDETYEKLKDKEEKSLALAMDELANAYHLFVADIGPIININYPEDVERVSSLLSEVKK